MYLRHEAGHAHQLRVRAVAARGLDADLRRLPAPVPRRLQPATRGAATTSATCTARACTTTRRSTPTRTGPRRSRSGWRAAPGGAATATGRSRWPSSSTSTASSSIERACRGNPGNVRLGMRVPYTEIKETVADYFDIGDDLDQDLLEYRSDLLEIFPRRPPRARAIARARPAAAHRQRAVGGALHPAAPEHPRRPHQALDRRQRQARHPPLPAPAAGAVHRRAHGRSRQPPHREAGRADRRRHLARRRRHPPTQLAGGSHQHRPLPAMARAARVRIAARSSSESGGSAPDSAAAAAASATSCSAGVDRPTSATSGSQASV